MCHPRSSRTVFDRKGSVTQKKSQWKPFGLDAGFGYFLSFKLFPTQRMFKTIYAGGALRFLIPMLA